jgi:hypothetical protein
MISRIPKNCAANTGLIYITTIIDMYGTYGDFFALVWTNMQLYDIMKS